MRQKQLRMPRTIRHLNALLQPVRELGACALTAALAAAPDATASAASRRRPAAHSPIRDASPVVLVHGYGGLRTQWLLVERALATRGYQHIIAMEYDACSTGIPGVARQLCQVVHAVLAETGASQVHLVGHSLGGVVIRYAVSALGLDEVVAAAVTVASPNGGCPIAQFATSTSAVQVRPGSRLLRQLESTARAGRARWTAFSAGCDIVVPAGRAQLRPEVLACENVTIPGEGHLSILSSPHLVRGVVRAIRAAEHAADVRSAQDRDRNLAAAA